MKKNAWEKLKKENNSSELNLTVEDIGYVNKVCTYAESRGVGLIETQLIRKDLIGMGLEAKKEGILLEERLGEAEVFARNIVTEGKKEDYKEKLFGWIKYMGIGSMVLAIFHGFLVAAGTSGNLLLSRNCSISQLFWIIGGLLVLTILHFLSGRYMFAKQKENLGLLMGLGCIWVIREFVRELSIGNQVSEIMLPNWILIIIFIIGLLLYIYGKYLFDRLLEKKAREYHLETL